MRCTFLVLIGAMGNGTSHTFMLGSYSGMRPDGSDGPVNPGVNAKGSVSSRIRAGSRAAAANVA